MIGIGVYRRDEPMFVGELWRCDGGKKRAHKTQSRGSSGQGQCTRAFNVFDRMFAQ